MRRRSSSSAAPALAAPSVHGLALGRKQARRRASRRRVGNQIVTTLLIAFVLALVGLAGYAALQAYGADQEQPTVTTESPQTVDEIIDHLDSQPRWNGPGSPAFGVGDEPASP